MSEKPEVLRLADVLDTRVVPRWIHSTGQTPEQSGYAADAECVQAAALLRRLHAENERLRAEIVSNMPIVGMRWIDRAEKAEAECDALRAEIYKERGWANMNCDALSETLARAEKAEAERDALRQIVADYPPIEAELREVSDRAFRAEAECDALRVPCRTLVSLLETDDWQATLRLAVEQARAALKEVK